MSPSLRLVAAILGLTFAGCHEGAVLGPADVSGSYDLFRYDGASPPRYYTTDHGCTVAVWGGSLVLGADGTFSLFVQRSLRCPGAAGLEWLNLGLSGTFDLAGLELRLNSSPGLDFGLTPHLRGSHVIVQLPQPAGLTPNTVTAEFAAGSGRTVVATTFPETTSTQPGGHPPDTGTVVIIVKRR